MSAWYVMVISEVDRRPVIKCTLHNSRITVADNHPRVSVTVFAVILNVPFVVSVNYIFIYS